MSDAHAPQRNDFRITHLARALGNDNFCNKDDLLLIFKYVCTILKPIFANLKFFTLR